MNNILPWLPACWTAIAERPREPQGRELLRWHELSDAHIPLPEAYALAAQGVILMANRHFPDRVELVVRAVRQEEEGQTCSSY